MPPNVTPSEDDEEIAALEADEDDEITDVAGLPIHRGAAPAVGLSVTEAKRGAFRQDSYGDAFAVGWDDEQDSLEHGFGASPAPSTLRGSTTADTLAPRATPLTPTPARRRAAAAPSSRAWAAVMVGVMGLFVGGVLTIFAGAILVDALWPETPAPPPALVSAPTVAPPVVAPPQVAEAPPEAPIEASVVPAEAPMPAAQPRARASKAAPAPAPPVAAEPAPEVKAPPPPAPAPAAEPDEEDKKGLFRRKKER